MRRCWSVGLGAGVALVACVPVATAAWGPPVTVHDAGARNPVTQAQAAGSGVDVLAWRAHGQVFVATRNGVGFVSAVLEGAPKQGQLVVAARKRRGAIGIAGPGGVTVFDTFDGGRHWRKTRIAAGTNAASLSMTVTIDGSLRAAFGTPDGLIVAAQVTRGAWTTQGELIAGASAAILAGQLHGSSNVLVADTGVALQGVFSQGAAFSAPATVLTTDDGTSVAGVAAAVRSTGAPVAVATVRETPRARPSVVAVRGTAENTWEDVPDSVSLPGAHVVAEAPILTPRLTNNLVTAWREASGARRRIVASVEVLSAAGAWRRPAVITPFAAGVGRPALGTAPDGRVLVAYTSGGDIFVRQLGGGTGAYVWSAPVRLNGTLLDCRSPSISFGPRDLASISYVCGSRVVSSRER